VNVKTFSDYVGLQRYRSDSDYFSKTFFPLRQGKGGSLMKPLRFHIFAIEMSQ